MLVRRLLLALAAAASILMSLTAVAPAAPRPKPVADPASYVDPKIGTGNAGGDVGTGDTSPAAALPYGMIQLGPDTDARTAVGYLDTARNITGFSLNHLSGVGCDYAGNDAGILPVVGPVERPNRAKEAFSHEASVAQAGYLATHLATSDVDAAMAVSKRAAVMDVDYPASEASRLLLRASSLNDKSGGAITVHDDGRLVTGTVRNNTANGSGGFCNKPNTYTVHFAVRVDLTPTGFGTWRGDAVTAGDAHAEGTKPDGTAAGAYLTFDTRTSSTVRLRVGMSYVSEDAAVANLDREVAGKSLADVREAATRAWDDLLGRLRVSGGSAAQRTNFYTAAYHALLAPNTFSDGDGRYIGFDNQVHRLAHGQHTQYANYSGWDTYRSQAALVALVDPAVAGDMAQSLVNDAEQGGFLPKWPVANGYTQVMQGDPADNIIAATHAFGATNFDAAAALRYMVKGADHGGGGADGVGQWGYVEREALGDYLGAGYVFGNPSLTQEYATSDAAIAQFARAVGRRDVYAKYAARAQNWQNVFNPATATGPYIQQRNGGGDFVPGPGFVEPSNGQFGQPGFGEGNAAQYTWMVTQDVAGLVAAMGGRDAATARLDALFADGAGDRWGAVGPNAPYFWFGNEPNFGTPWIYNYTGRPWKTQATVRRVLDDLFSPTSAGLPGNDDLGAVSSWYVWGAMGLYPLNPGTADLQLSTPLFSRVEIRRPRGKSIVIEAPGTADHPYIAGARLGGHVLDRPWLPASAVTGHGRTLVRLDLSARPDRSWGSGADAAPPSDRTGEAPGIAFTTPSGALEVPAGGSRRLTVGVRNITRAPLYATWSAAAPGGLQLSADSGDIAAGPLADGTDELTVTVPPDTPYGTYDLPVRVSVSRSFKPLLLRVSVVAPGQGFTEPSGTLAIRKGEPATLRTGLRNRLDSPLHARWAVDAPDGVTVTPRSGELTAPARGEARSPQLTVTADASAPEGFAPITVHYQTDDSGFGRAIDDVRVDAAIIGTGDRATVCDSVGAPGAERGVKLVQVGIDGLTEPVTIGGSAAQRSVPAANPGRYFYFDVDDRIAHDGDFDATLEVTYWNDSGRADGFGWGVQYDSTSSSYESASGGSVGTSPGWKTATIDLPHARFHGGENGGADLRISQPAGASDPAMIVRDVRLEIAGDGVLPMDWCSANGGGTGVASVSDILGPTDEPNGLFRVGPPAADDGDSQGIADVEGTGRSGRQMLQHDTGWGRYLYFDVDDALAFDADATMQVTVTYFDDNSVSKNLGIQYQSTSDTWTGGPGIAIGDTHTWKTATLTVEHARLGNGEKGADFRLSGGADNVYADGQRVAGGLILGRVDVVVSGDGVQG